MAYGAALRYAGARVIDDEVYEHAFSSDEAGLQLMMDAVNLMKIMLPASARARLEAAMAADDEDSPPTKVLEGLPQGNPLATAQASSKQPTKQRSPKASG